MRVAGIAPNEMSDSFQSRRKQFTSITTTVMPSRRYVATASVIAICTVFTSAEKRVMMSPE